MVIELAWRVVGSIIARRIAIKFFVSLSISPSQGGRFGLTFGFGYKFFEWMPFALNLCHFFRKGNFRLVSSLFNVPHPDIYVLSLPA
jgi:hypothetical protein